jgi:hypothetical protein
VKTNATVRTGDLEATLDYLEGLVEILTTLSSERRGRDEDDELLSRLQALHGFDMSWSRCACSGGWGQAGCPSRTTSATSVNVCSARTRRRRCQPSSITAVSEGRLGAERESAPAPWPAGTLERLGARGGTCTPTACIAPARIRTVHQLVDGALNFLRGLHRRPRRAERGDAVLQPVLQRSSCDSGSAWTNADVAPLEPAEMARQGPSTDCPPRAGGQGVAGSNPVSPTV